MSILFASLPILAVLFLLLVIGIVISKLYTRSSPERAFVRTGLGGGKVIISGGSVVLPIFHDVIWVNRNTLRLRVERGEEQSLITADRLRVDVTAEFYVRVAASTEAIATAAQTLGSLTMNPDGLRALVEGKFVDALRSAAAKMTMQELHELRSDFVQNVKKAVSEDLAENGLELESVSLTGLNQTNKSYFDANNAFDAQGLLILTEAIETRNKARNDIEQDTKVQIAQKDLIATEAQLKLKRQREEAILSTDRDIAAATAAQQAEIAITAAEGRRKGEEANLLANQQIAQRRIETTRVVSEDQAVANQKVETIEIDSRIAVANKSKEEAAAQAEADTERAKAVTAEESVETARQVEVATRQKAVSLVQAEEKARKEATGVLVAAEAEKESAENRASAMVTLATGERDAAKLRAEGTIAEGNAVAQALLEKNEAQNKLNPALIEQQIKLAMITTLPAIIEQSVKPLENIDSIRIAEVGGLNASGGASCAGGTSGSGNGGLGNEVVNAALRYRGAQPVVDALLAEVGLKGGGDMSALLSSAAGAAGVAMAGGNVPSVAPIMPFPVTATDEVAS
jgi:uncharacterized membrane protein YqiK